MQNFETWLYTTSNHRDSHKALVTLNQKGLRVEYISNGYSIIDNATNKEVAMYFKRNHVISFLANGAK